MMSTQQDYVFRPQAAGQPPRLGVCMAGHALMDITPPPNMPKAGYSTNGQTAKAFRTRLKARVIYLRACNGQSMALVQLDLLGGSLIVLQRVTELVAAHTDLGSGQILLGATHTHAGPGQYASCEFYNRFASNRAGFEPQFVEFLSQQISQGIIRAYQQARPARVAVGSAQVWGLTRNRSLIPHFQNEQRLVRHIEAHAAFYAIDPRLNLLRIDVQHGEAWLPIAALSTFAIHATGVSQHNDEYHADVWAHIERGLEQHAMQRYALPWRFAHAAIEGTHGDIAPAIRFGAAGHLETRRIGEAIAQHAIHLFDRLADQGQPLEQLSSLFEIVDVQTLVGLAQPMAGAAIAAGASENLTPLLHRIPPFRAGSKRLLARWSAQGEKITLPTFLSHWLVASPDEYPRWLPLQVLKLADWLLVAVPFEVTVAAGQQIEQAIRQATGHQGLVSVSSVCNDYWGYCTTLHEYRCQHYEGGHTLFGGHSQQVIAQYLANMAADLHTQQQVRMPEQLHFQCKVVHYLDQPTAPQEQAEWQTFPIYQPSALNQEDYWVCQWRDVHPSQIAWHQPYVAIEYSDNRHDWHPLTCDEGVDMGVRWRRNESQGMASYEGYWYNPTFLATRCYRFVVHSRASGVLYSAVFGGNILTDQGRF